MSNYLDLAKRTIRETPAMIPTADLTDQKHRRLEEASMRGLIVKRSKELGWISLHDPLTGEWHDFPSADCFPSIVADASRPRRQGLSS